MDITYQLIPPKSSGLITRDDIVIDSTFPSSLRCIRIDHHIDNGWTNLDSVFQFNDWDLRSPAKRIVTTYLDPDAIISAAAITMKLREALSPMDLTISRIGMALYSASFWCDYGVECRYIDEVSNELGDKIEIFIRQELDKYLGEDRFQTDEERAAKHSALFTRLVSDFCEMIRSRSLPSAVYAIDSSQYLEEMGEHFQRYRRTDLGSKSIGLLHVINEELRVIPRSYFRLFDQPIIVRAIQQNKENSKIQIMIGPNPLKSGWEFLDFIKIAELIAQKTPNMSFDGRRYLIGSRIEDTQLAELMSILGELDLNVATSPSPMWSFLSLPG